MENKHSINLLKQAIINIAEKTNSVQDFFSVLSDIGLTHQDMLELNMQFVITHEYCNKANFMFMNDQEQARLLMQKWAASCKAELDTFKCDEFVDKDHITLIYRIRPFKDELHVFSIAEI